MSSPYPIEDADNVLGPEEELFLKPFQYEEEDNFEDKGKIALHMYCHDRKSNSVGIRIDNFRVYCCIALPTYCLQKNPSPDGDFKKDTFSPHSYITWDVDLAKKIFKKLCDNTAKKDSRDTKLPKDPPFDYYFNYFDDIYYYTGQKKPYLYLYFNTIQARKDMLDTIHYPIYVQGEGYMQFEMHENKIPTFRRLMSKQNIKYTSWISVKGRRVPITNKRDRVMKHSVHEYIVDYTTMKQVDENVSLKWFVYPKVVSWDGEMYAKNHKQMPNSGNPLDAIYLISFVFQYMEHPETRRKYCLVYGDCDDIPGSEIIRFKTERELLFGFCHMFNYLDPDIAINYNGSSFDYPYIIGRFLRNDVSIQDIPSTGRLLRKLTSIYEMNWSSSGAGKNNIMLIKHDGRIPVDLLPNLKRLYKLRQYTLQYASMEFLGEGKHDIKAKDMFRIYEDARAEKRGVLVKDHDGVDRVLTMTDVASYCIQDSILPIKLFDNRKLWYHLSSLSNAAGVSILELFTRGEQIRCYSNIADECFKQGIVLSNPQYFDYYFKGGFVGKPKPGVYKYVFTLDFASLYPSIMRAYNISIDSIIKIEDWPKFDPDDYEINVFDQIEPFDFVSTSYRKDLELKYRILLRQHQLVEEYKQFMVTGQVNSCSSTEDYLNQIKRHAVTFNNDDFVTMREMGIKDAKRIASKVDDLGSDETINYDPDYFKDGDDPEDSSYEGLTGVKRRYEIRIIKKKIYEGIMSLLESRWFSKRKGIKKLMGACEKRLKRKYNKDVDSEKTCHNASQNAVKTMMNSGYGFNGVSKGMLPALPVAILVTAIGRRLIGLVNDLLLEKFAHLGAKIVYNDTDSSMIALDINDADVLSGKINLEEIMEEMEDVTNGRPEKIVYNTDSTVISNQTERILDNDKVDYVDKKILYDNGMVKETVVYKSLKIDGVEYINVTTILYKDDATIKCIKEKIDPVFREELQMECENCCQMCPLKPKYYIKLHREVNPELIRSKGEFKRDKNGNFEITTKGILTSKKGNSHLANTIYDGLVNRVIFIKHPVEMIQELTKHMCDFLSDKFPIKDLCRVTSIGTDYKSDSHFMAVFSQYLASQGMPVTQGDRIEYIVVRTKKEILENITENVGVKCREYTMWEADPDKENIDYTYYIEKGLQDQYDCLFKVGNMNIINDPRLEFVGYKPQFSRDRQGVLKIGSSGCKFIHFSTPIKMLAGLVKDYMKLSDTEFVDLYMSYGREYDSKYPRNFYIGVIVNTFMDRVCKAIQTVFPMDSI